MTITHGYTDLQSVKDALRIVDGVDDTLIERAIEAASRRIDGETGGRRFWADPTPTTRLYAATNSDVLFVDDIATSTGLVIQTDTAGDGTFATTLASSDYQLELLNAVADGRPYEYVRAITTTWPVHARLRASVRITATFGWASVPVAIREACAMLASRHFKRNDSPLGVAGFGDMGAIMVRRLDPDVAELLRPFNKTSVA